MRKTLTEAFVQLIGFSGEGYYQHNTDFVSFLLPGNRYDKHIVWQDKLSNFEIYVTGAILCPTV